MEVTTPAVIDAVATAVVPSPTDCAVPPILIVGAVEYPTPPEDIDMEDIVPRPDTIAVAAAPVLVSCETSVTLFWKVRLVASSTLESKKGLILST